MNFSYFSTLHGIAVASKQLLINDKFINPFNKIEAQSKYNDTWV